MSTRADFIPFHQYLSKALASLDENRDIRVTSPVILLGPVMSLHMASPHYKPAQCQ